MGVEHERIAAAATDIAGRIEDIVVDEHRHAIDDIVDAVVVPGEHDGAIVADVHFHLVGNLDRFVSNS